MNRLLVIDPGLSLWGSERALLATVPDLVASHQAVVAVVPHGAALGPKLAACGVTVCESPIDHLGRRSMLLRAKVIVDLIVLCLRYRIDVIALNQAGLCRVASLVAQALGKRLVIHVRIAEDLMRVAHVRATARAPVNAILISQDMARRFGRPDLRNPHFGVHIAYDVFEQRPPAGRVRLENAFVCVGRIAAVKGQRELAEAFVLLARRDVSARLDLIGAASQEPTYGAHVRDVIAKAALQDRVTFHGYRDDADDALSGYAFVVVPSRYEPLGRVVFEGWNAGCVPICSAESGGAAEIVCQSGGGLTYAGFDPASLADAMRRALALTSEERARLVERGRRWMRDNASRTAYRTALAGVLFPQNIGVTHGACQTSGLHS